MTSTTTVTVVEIDVPVCLLTYGTAPCTASIPTTGDRKCFNTRATCQDSANFTASEITLRFFRPSGDPEIFDGMAVLRQVDLTPQVLDPGNTIGQRESVRVILDDFQDSDAGLDKYLATRGYNPYDRGTFWGRFRARIKSLRGAELRVMRGEAGQPLNTFATWHYVIETTAGPAGGAFSITAKDALKLADGDRAQAPRPTGGQLSVDLAAGAGSCTLLPTGIGDLKYPSAGKVAIGGNEIASFTRVADVLTLTTRGLHTTDDADHDSGERVQVVLEYSGKRPDELLVDLLLGYTDINPAWIDQAAWQAEIEAYTPRLYGAILAEPTAVRTLINELVEQIGLVLWMDTREQALRLRGLRAVGSDAALVDADRFMAGSFSSTEQTNKRVSQSWCYFGLKNPLENATDPKNYACIDIGVDDTEADEEYGGEAIRTTFSRWISAFNRQAAQRLNEVLLSRYRDPPRRIALDLYVTDAPPQLGAGAFVKHFELQDDTGQEVQVPVQVIELQPTEDRFGLTCEEQQPVAPDIVTEEKTVYIDANAYNLNLRTVYDSIYSAPGPYDLVTFIVGGSVKIGTQNGGNKFAITSGEWPELAEPPTLLIQGRVVGRGGDGGLGGDDEEPNNGRPGEHALQATSPIKVRNQGTIGGGGGGGGGAVAIFGGQTNASGGGGGQGFENSNGGGGGGTGTYPGFPGTIDAPGTGNPEAFFVGATGGALGAVGEDANGGGGGPAGIAVHGDNLIDWLEEGTILGARLDDTDPVP